MKRIGEDSVWREIYSIHAVVALRCREAFGDPIRLGVAISSYDDAVEIIEECVGDSVAEHDKPALADRLWRWSLSRESRRAQQARLLAASAEAAPIIPFSSQGDVGRAYELIQQQSPSMSLKILEKSLRSQKSGYRSDREAFESAEKRRWSLKLAEFIEEAEMPLASRVAGHAQATQLWERAFGARRSKTLRNRAMVWAKVRSWMKATLGKPWPAKAEHLLTYLEERHESQGMGKSVPNGILGALALLEQVGQVEADKRLSEDRLLIEACRSWTAELEQDAPPKKQAPMYTIAVILSAELCVCKATCPIGLRFYAFVLLLLIWTTMRCDDIQGVDPGTFVLSQIGVKFIIRRTKTTGPGKAVGHLFGYVGRGVGLTGYDWLAEGVRLLKNETLARKRDYFCLGFNEDWTIAQDDYLEPEGVAVHLRRLLLSLRVPVRVQSRWGIGAGTLIEPPLHLYWSGHSARHTLPSLAALIDISKERRDFLGRWSAAQHGSADYILTSRQVVHSIQTEVCVAILEGRPAPGFVEEESIAQISDFLVRNGGDPNTVALKHAVLKWDGKRWSLGGKFPMVKVDLNALRQARGDASVALAPEVSEREVDAPYFVTISRTNGFRRLHVSHGCAVKQERCLETRPVYHLTEGIADAICKLCRPAVEEQDFGSSDSGSETAQVGPAA